MGNICIFKKKKERRAKYLKKTLYFDLAVFNDKWAETCLKCIIYVSGLRDNGSEVIPVYYFISFYVFL